MTVAPSTIPSLNSKSLSTNPTISSSQNSSNNDNNNNNKQVLLEQFKNMQFSGSSRNLSDNELNQKFIAPKQELTPSNFFSQPKNEILPNSQVQVNNQVKYEATDLNQQPIISYLPSKVNSENNNDDSLKTNLASTNSNNNSSNDHSNNSGPINNSNNKNNVQNLFDSSVENRMNKIYQFQPVPSRNDFEFGRYPNRQNEKRRINSLGFGSGKR